MKIYVLTAIKYSILILLFSACSASTGSRYENDKNSDGNEGDKAFIITEEDFDITPYKIKIDIEESGTRNAEFVDAWYEYGTDSNNLNITSNRKIIGTVDGFRVLVIATDDMDEANSVRSNIYKQIKRKEVYISFEPPFYKVKVGDFTDITQTNNLKFKLNQLGYTEARVVQETVNLFEE
jgi:hypothetical protein